MGFFFFFVNHQAKYRLKEKKNKTTKKGKKLTNFYIFTRVNKLNVAQVCRPGGGGGGCEQRCRAPPPDRSVETPPKIKIKIKWGRGETRRIKGGWGGSGEWRSHLDGADAPGGRGGDVGRRAVHVPHAGWLQVGVSVPPPPQVG